MFGSNKLSSITNMRFFVSGADMFNCLVSNDHGKINFMKKKLFLGTVFSKKGLYFPPVTHCFQVWFRERAAFQNTVETSVYVRDGCQGRGTVLY